MTLQNRESNELNLPVILDAIGVDHVQVVDAFDRDAVRGALKEALGRDELDGDRVPRSLRTAFQNEGQARTT